MPVPTKRCELGSMSQKPNLEALVLTLETETLITQVLTPLISKANKFRRFFSMIFGTKKVAKFVLLVQVQLILLSFLRTLSKF